MTIERDYSDKDLRAALGSSPPLEKMKMGHMPEHSQTPWRLQHVGLQEADLISGGTMLGLNGGSGAPKDYGPDDAAQWEADVNFVLRAVNCHDELVDALQVCLGHLTGGLDGDWRDCDPAELARSVLARAKASHGAGT